MSCLWGRSEGRPHRVRPRANSRDVAGVWGITPRQSIDQESARRGVSAVVSRCVAILNGREADDDFLLVLAGPAAESVINGLAGGKDGYWPRVWAMRALLYAWEDRASAVVIGGTADDAWRVREMALKVMARQRLGEGLEPALGLQRDTVRRVRAAAERAVQILVAAQV
jgi:hypothetical protein